MQLRPLIDVAIELVKRRDVSFLPVLLKEMKQMNNSFDSVKL